MTTHTNWEEEFDIKWDNISPKKGFFNALTNQRNPIEIKQFISQTIHKALEAHKEEVRKLEKKYVWDNGECSICTFIENDTGHYCASYNEALADVLSLPSLLKDNK
jgi:hypothetical protein